MRSRSRTTVEESISSLHSQRIQSSESATKVVGEEVKADEFIISTPTNENVNDIEETNIVTEGEDEVEDGAPLIPSLDLAEEYSSGDERALESMARRHASAVDSQTGRLRSSRVDTMG